ncbi:fatty acyl-CoA hydrolase precursor, medium chain-like [Lagopus leucura]|uniref:fatty acyl-CoA hydrolase precursor, medium chain-like n=1 Tax=Lagopus leucura TaxID=30410 RepID=UPI001C6818DA|nr:fatty acyl-CoA hydrolase precursor, medium chain-like [Lagopus leucura]
MAAVRISACVDGVFLPKSPKQLLSEKAINAIPYILGINNCEFGWGIPKMMKFPDFTHGLDREVAYQLLQNSLESSFEVRDHFQNNPVLLLEWDNSVFMFLKLHMETRKDTWGWLAPGDLRVAIGSFASF